MLPLRRMAATLAALSLLVACGNGGDSGGSAERSAGGDVAGLPVEDVLAVAALYVEENPPRVVGHDPSTGDELWELEGTVPLVFGFDEIGVTTRTWRELVGFDLASGDRVWQLDLDDRAVVFAAGRDELVVVTGTEITAIEGSSGERRWSRPVDEVPGLLATGSRLLLAADGELALVDLASGEAEWERELGRTRLRPTPWTLDRGIVTAFGPSVPAATVDDELAVVVLDDGGVVALDVEDGSERWRLDEVHAWAVARDADVVAITTEERLLGVDPATGATRWEWAYADHLPGADVFDTVRYDDIVLVVGGEGGGIAAIGMADGELRWQQGGEYRYLSPGASVITAVIDGEMGALDPENGDLAWSVAGRATPETVRDAADGVMIVFGPGDEARAVEAGSGDVRWTRSLDTWFGD